MNWESQIRQFAIEHEQNHFPNPIEIRLYYSIILCNNSWIREKRNSRGSCAYQSAGRKSGTSAEALKREFMETITGLLTELVNLRLVIRDMDVGAADNDEQHDILFHRRRIFLFPSFFFFFFSDDIDGWWLIGVLEVRRRFDLFGLNYHFSLMKFVQIIIIVN